MQSQALLRLTLGAGLALSAAVTSAQMNAPAAEAVPESTAAARVSIDPASGKLRPVEHDDASRVAAPASRSPLHGQGAPRQIYSRTGVRGMALDESFMSYTVVRVKESGGLDSVCVQGEPAALRQLNFAPQSRTVKAGGAYETE